MQQGKKFWKNGKMLPAPQAVLSLYSNTLHYGFGVFDGIRSYKTSNGPALFRLEDHMQRLLDSWKSLGRKPKYSKKELCNACIQVARENFPNTECYLRPMIYLSEINFDPADCREEYAILCWIWNDFFRKKEHAVKVMLSQNTRHYITPEIANSKITGSYYNALRLRSIARQGGFNDQLLRDSKGNICEGTADNFFIVKGGKLLTPQEGEILNGVTRDTVLKIAKELRIEAQETQISEKMLLQADEIFLTGTAAEIEPVVAVGSKPIGNGKEGKFTTQIRDEYGKIVHGKNPKFMKYLTHINSK